MHTQKRAFTLIELMIVVSILGLLAGMMVPSMDAALEQSRIVACASTLHHIANALNGYVADNHNYFPYNAANNDFRPMIGEYLGLGPCLAVGNNANGRYVYFSNNTGGNLPWEQIKPFQCPTGAGLGKSARVDGQQAVQGYWLSNWYVSQSPLNDYYPSLQTPRQFDPEHDGNNYGWGGPSHIGLLCEEWQVDNIYTAADSSKPPDPNTNIVCSVVASNLAQPYSTHYKFGNMGVMGVGRNILYGDWHINFRKCTYSASTDCATDAGYWVLASDPPPVYKYIKSTQIDRGNEVGQSFQIPTGTGPTYWGWRPMLQDPDIAYWWGS